MKVSVLSAVYNEEQHLPEMLESLQTQQLEDWEALFIDDGFTDRTIEIIKQASHGDPRIRLVSSGIKLGKVKAFNLSFAASTGEVVVLCAGDDRLPADSLSIRHLTVASVAQNLTAVGFFKLRTFSDNPRFDGMLLPRGDGGSRSGGSITMNRCLADQLFPIDESLISEDIWLAYASVGLAREILEEPRVVLEYRIHEGNSNPRNRTFNEMNESMHLRHRAWAALLECPRFELKSETITQLAHLWQAEQFRHQGRTLALLRTPLPIIERAAMASMASPILFNARNHFYKFFSGRRNR